MRPPTSAPALADFTLVERVCFLAAWRPGLGRGRWRTWSEYLADYRRVRGELLASFPRSAARPMFGALALAYLDAHGAEALEQATNEDIRACEPRAPA